jgi:hypothetical protein
MRAEMETPPRSDRGGATIIGYLRGSNRRDHSSSEALPISSNSSEISNSAAASSSAASSWIDLPEACSSASSGERATFSVIFADDFRVQHNRNGVQAQFLDRLVQHDLRAGDREAALGGRIGCVAGGN